MPTVREKEVLTLMSAGLCQKEVASKLSISEETVKTHLCHIYKKLDAHNCAEAVAKGIRQGLI